MSKITLDKLWEEFQRSEFYLYQQLENSICGDDIDEYVRFNVPLEEDEYEGEVTG
jgi:hypothetical protein